MFPSKSLTPPREDQEDVAPLYPSYWPLSVLNLIAPLSTIPEPGLPALSPAGITRALVASTFTVLPVAGVKRRLLPAVVLMLLLLILMMVMMPLFYIHFIILQNN